MLSRNLVRILAMTLLGASSSAQQTAVPPSPPNPRVLLDQPDKTVTYASAADLAALIARAKREQKDDLPLVVGKVLQLDPYTAYLEYRPAGKALLEPVGIHPKDAELVYVLQGAGRLVTGGIVSADRKRMDGGESKTISKGDVFVIPEGVPHWVTHIDQDLVLMSIHLPRPIPAR